MIKVIDLNPQYEYEVKELLKLFYPPDEVAMNQEADVDDEASILELSFQEQGKVIALTVRYKHPEGERVYQEEQSIVNDPLGKKKLEKRMIKRGIYTLITEAHGVYLPWGTLVGIRPTKLAHELIERGLPAPAITQELQEEHLMNGEKAELLLSVAQREYPYLYPLREDLISVYISIPFCPSRCVYCSFPSNAIKTWGYLQAQYLDALCKEIEATASHIRSSKKTIETLYIGGGTPSVLTVPQLQQLIGVLKRELPLDNLKEFTFEAGRPDTIDEEKLKTLLNLGVTRLSINPQTMNDCTLEAIGRGHSVLELKEAYALAKDVGFDNINMDLILGLPGENEVMVRHTLEEVKALAPENLTVHTLAVKNASKLKEAPEAYGLIKGSEMMEMLRMSQSYARAMGLVPYYLYRQKHMLGNLENIGYCRPGAEGIYNIKIMEEKQTILAFGAGGISKFVYLDENRLERVPNVKNLEHYLARYDEMAQRKINLLKSLDKDA